MAIVKHIKNRNANYSAAINYLLFEHDEKTGKKIVDESGRSILRKEFYMDGLNCDPMSFDKECELTNAHFHKNKKREDVKSHHYIISYDPADVTENGLTGERAQTISLELAKQMFPGYQALVVTHTDGHNESGNIHTHIVINSVRKTAVERQPYIHFAFICLTEFEILSPGIQYSNNRNQFIETFSQVSGFKGFSVPTTNYAFIQHFHTLKDQQVIIQQHINNSCFCSSFANTCLDFC